MKSTTFASLWLSVGLMCVATFGQGANAEDAKDLPVKLAFGLLPPGAVEPAGWLRDWAVAAREGITGHLDEYHPTFRDGWKNILIDTAGAEPDGAGWPLEQSSYWLDGLMGLGCILHDDALIQRAHARLNLVVDGVNRGGKSFLYWRTDMPQGFNSWAHSHMGRALAAWYEATGEKRILDAMVRAYAEYPVPMGHLRFNTNDVSGLCNIEAMLKAYQWSRDPRLLERAQAVINTPENQATIQQWLDDQFEAGHTVIAYEQIRLPALFYLWTGEDKYLQASRNAFRWFDEHHMMPFGVASGEEFLSGVGAFRATETCDVTAQIWSTAWLYQITGERSWGDSIERSFFNAGPAPIARDWQTMCYYQSPNRISGTLPGNEPLAPGKGCFTFTKLGCPQVICCVANVNRLIPSYVTRMWMTTSDRGLAATLYGPCSVTAVVGESTPVKLTCETAYPFEETNRVRVEPECSASFPLYFRIPEWCANPQLRVNDLPVDVNQDKNGFVRIERQWSKGDSVMLVFPMSVDVAHGFESEYPASAKSYFTWQSPAMFEQRRLPYETVSHGPLLFALPIPDKDPNTPEGDAKWQYALNNDAERNGDDIEVERRPMPAMWNWPLDAPVALKVPAKAFDWSPTDLQALPNTTVDGVEAGMIRLVPYGCTKFRISMFPVTEKAFPSRESMTSQKRDHEGAE